MLAATASLALDAELPAAQVLAAGGRRVGRGGRRSVDGSPTATTSTPRGATARSSSASWCGTRTTACRSRARSAARGGTRARSARCCRSRRGRPSTSSTCGCAGRAPRRHVRAAPRRLLPARAPLDPARARPAALDDAARRAARLHVARRAARARRPDRAHARRPPPRVHEPTAAAERADEVVETALWLSLLRALSGFEPFMKRAAGRISSEAVARVPDLGDRVPALDRVLRPLGARPAVRTSARPSAHELPGGEALERLRVLDAWVRARAPEPLARRQRPRAADARRRRGPRDLRHARARAARGLTARDRRSLR